ncbi:MAG: ZIP family metal transporter [Bacteroidales bacterium]|nr:ZIP family metal transporter [Bacteroidales bacterium]
MRIEIFFGLFLPVIIAGISVFYLKLNEKFLKLLVAFSGAYLISLVFNELVPQIYSSIVTQAPHDACAHDEQFHQNQNSMMSHVIGLLILAGFFFQLVLDYLTKGIEHGHTSHHHRATNHNHEIGHSEKSIAFIPVLIGLFLHSFLEGMPLANGLSSYELQNRLLTGIIIHNIPISIVLVSLMIQSNVPKFKAISFLFIFALSAPAGALTTHITGTLITDNASIFFNYIMAVVVGIFLHISTTILFETDENHRFNFIKFITMVAGAFAAIAHF